MSRNNSVSRLGFTFIELLVVTTILGVLMSIAVVSYVQTSRAGRDSRRQKDLSAIQTALEFYRVENGVYPPSCTTSCSPSSSADIYWIPDLAPEFVDALPVDPREGAGIAGQTYTYELSGGQYTLTAQLEDGSEYVLSSPR